MLHSVGTRREGRVLAGNDALRALVVGGIADLVNSEEDLNFDDQAPRALRLDGLLRTGMVTHISYVNRPAPGTLFEVLDLDPLFRFHNHIERRWEEKEASQDTISH